MRSTVGLKPPPPWLCFSEKRISLKDPPRVGSCGLILDRSRKLVGLQSPATCATRAGGDSGPNFENYDPFYAQSPDTGHGSLASSWRANRDVDVRR